MAIRIKGLQEEKFKQDESITVRLLPLIANHSQSSANSEDKYEKFLDNQVVKTISMIKQNNVKFLLLSK